MAKIVLFGPGPQFKGGISNYNTSLAKALDKQGVEVNIVSWTQQYPSIIPRDFKDRTSKVTFLEGTNVKVDYLTNYNNPFSWAKTVKHIKALKPKAVVFQWAIALQGLPMGWMARRLRNSGIEVIFVLHLVAQKEASSIDKYFSKYGLSKVPTYITHAYKTVEELKSLFPKRDYTVTETGERTPGKANQIIKLFHPIYDLFEPLPDFDIEAQKKEWGLKKNVLMYFGFIRKYKGLHQAIEAFKLVADKRDDVSMIIAGESFWNTLDDKKLSTKIKQFLFGFASKLLLKKKDDERGYDPIALVKQYGLEDKTAVFNRFIPNEEVPKFFQVADAIVLYYLNATPSGIESLSYNFQLPVLATKVGHFPETIEHGYNGYLAEDRDVQSMAAEMERMIDQPISRENIAQAAKNMSWENYATAILKPHI